MKNVNIVLLNLIWMFQVLLPAAPVVIAADIEKGIEAFQRGDFATALEEWKPLAEDGIPLAQNNLGYLYHSGSGLIQDYIKAAYWYKKAAEQGLALAQTNLGVMYEKGEGVEKDYIKAVYWYKKAVEQGEVFSQNNLGFIYLNGKGVEKKN